MAIDVFTQGSGVPGPQERNAPGIFVSPDELAQHKGDGLHGVSGEEAPR
jgi:hypothetical protein